MARGPLCSSPEPTYTLDHRADPLGTGARCAAMRSITGYTRVSARRYLFFPLLGESIIDPENVCRYILVFGTISDFFTTEGPSQHACCMQ